MHHVWKRGAVACMAAALLMGSVPALAWQAPEDDAWQAASREGVAARFFVGSDVHIGRNSDADAKLTNALNVFEEIDPQADGVLLVGDVTNNGAASEYDRLMELIRANPLSEKVVLAMGNHEYNNASGAVERFESKTGQETNEVRYYRDDSGALTATVVKLGASNYGGNYTGSYDMLKTALETATAENAEAPVIVLGHHGIRNTAYVTHEWYGNYGEGTDRDMVALMKEYPQVIHISGHSHSTLEDARSIYQDDGYTAIQDSTIGAYFENESGKVDPNTGSGETCPVDAEESSQALRIDVMEDGTVDIYRLDLTDGDYMYAEEPWTFDANDASDRPYTSARADQSDVPSFAADAAVTVSAVTKNSAVVHFPAAQAASDENVDMIQAYRITLTPDNGGAARTVQVFSDYYKDASRQREDWTVKVTGLEQGVTYTPSVEALTSYEKASTAITGQAFNTSNPAYVTPQADVLNVDFDLDQTGTDANGHEIKVFGQPTVKYDEELGRNVMVFDGQDDGLRYAMSQSDYTELVDGITVELYYKPLDNKNNDPMGNTQLSGFCFEQKSGTNTVEFWTRVGGTYVKPAAQVTQGAWNHLVGTFDGSSVKLYLNGELQDTKSASGSMAVPPLYMFLGGDTTSGGSLEYAANCEIALARVYTGAMNAEDVQKAYEEATQPDDVQPGEVNTYLLEKTVEYAQSLVDSGATNGVTDAAKAAFDKALSDAKAVLEKENPTQAEVDAAWDALLEGIWALGLVKGDVTMLEQLVAKAEAMVAEQDKYVQTDWQQLVDALAQAQELLEDSGNALAGDVEEASDALLNAILAQRYKANKENLEDILNQAQAVDLSGYTAQSVAVFQAALAEAQALMADETLSVEDQDAVDAAVEALASAMNGLTAETTPQPTQTPEASQTPEATQKPAVSEKPETNVPQTGDASQLAAMVGVLMSSATALGGVAIARKRRNG